MPVLYFIMIHLALKETLDDVRQALLAAPLAVPSLMRAGLVVLMVVRFSFGISQFMEKMHMCLKGVTVVC